ncbi:MAG: nitroreductase family protein, partial [Spirochaetota bacterium]
MDGLTMLYTRRSVRSFKTDAVADDIIGNIVRAGQLAATARNVQPWEFVVVKTADVRRQIAAVTENGKFIEHAPVCIAVLCQDTKYYLEDGAAAT